MHKRWGKIILIRRAIPAVALGVFICLLVLAAGQVRAEQQGISFGTLERLHSAKMLYQDNCAACHGYDGVPLLPGAANFDLTRLFLLGNIAREIDGQKPVLERSIFNFDVIRKLEAALESTPGNAVVKQVLAFLVVFFLGTAAQCQRVFVQNNVDIIRFETGNRHGDAVVIFVDLLDIVGRVGKVAFRILRRIVEHSGHSVEANAGTKQGGKIIGCTHWISSVEQYLAGGYDAPDAPSRPRLLMAVPKWQPPKADVGSL